jgi:hypothetical protein
MINKTLLYAVSSVLLPFIAYASVFFLAGLSPAQVSDTRMYVPLLLFNAVGLALAVIALSRSNVKPTNISPKMRIAVLFGGSGVLANTIAVEMLLSNTVFHSSQL